MEWLQRDFDFSTLLCRAVIFGWQTQDWYQSAHQSSKSTLFLPLLCKGTLLHDHDHFYFLFRYLLCAIFSFSAQIVTFLLPISYFRSEQLMVIAQVNKALERLQKMVQREKTIAHAKLLCLLLLLHITIDSNQGLQSFWKHSNLIGLPKK